MSRNYQPQTLEVLNYLVKNASVAVSNLHTEVAPKEKFKDFYNLVYRLKDQELVEETDKKIAITEIGKKILFRHKPQKDGEWKMVIFDIPEKHKYVRTILRSKLKQLHFKKWQNSIWVSPYALDAEIETELGELGKKFFVRLIKTKDINNITDLEKLFPE